jgi:hypothetical protein
MSQYDQGIWKDCNCMNCRLARIEDNIKKIKDMMDNLPPDMKSMEKGTL